MKKLKAITAIGLALTMLMGSVTAFAGDDVANAGIIDVNSDSTGIIPYAFPERPSGRTWEDEYTSREGYNNAAEILNIISNLNIPFVSSLSGFASALFKFTGARQDLTYFVGEVEEYYVYDFEGEVISYKYYITMNVYSDARHKNLLYSYDTVKSSTSPMKIEEIM